MRVLLFIMGCGVGGSARQLRLVIPLLVLNILGARSLVRQEQIQDAFDVGGYPAEMQAAASLTARRCSACHSIERVTRALHEGSAWKPVVQRMSRKRRARITQNEKRRITAFLSYHTSAKKSRQREPPPKGLQGGTNVYPRIRFAVLESAPVPDMLSPPFKIELEKQPCTIGAITRKQVGLPGESVSMTGHYRGRTFRVSLARAANGFTSAGTETIHAWTIGPHHFRLVLALWRPPSEEDLPDLALLVERVPRPR